mmetsp:Transcript_23598/g.34313  ORF Transcript_23598/g.34313 Transcript_23598/m.34313 type:complete len:164 (-) Transcript_23598:312-803(-)
MFGLVGHVKVISPGTALVRYYDRFSAEAALARGKSLGGLPLDISWHDPRVNKPANKTEDGPQEAAEDAVKPQPSDASPQHVPAVAEGQSEEAAADDDTPKAPANTATDSAEDKFANSSVEDKQKSLTQGPETVSTGDVGLDKADDADEIIDYEEELHSGDLFS